MCETSPRKRQRTGISPRIAGLEVNRVAQHSTEGDNSNNSSSYFDLVLISDKSVSALPPQIEPVGIEQVCFGMITGIALNQEQKSTASHGTCEAVWLHFSAEDQPTRVISQLDEAFHGTLSKHDSIILSSIAEASDMVIQSTLIRGTASQPSLNAIIYGPLVDFHEIGDYLGEQRKFLQVPYGCDRNMPYRNPHSLKGLDKSVPTTFELPTDLLAISEAYEKTPQLMQKPIDILDGFESKQTLTEATAPKILKSDLYSHQKQALTYMTSREQGWNFETNLDLWSLSKDPQGLVCYKNNISGDTQLDEPPNFRGGILADEMGLGKTLSIISLIASDGEKDANFKEGKVGRRHARATLLIVPSSLLETWENELQKHIHPNKLRWVKYYGSNRIRDNADAIHDKYDLVLTTLMTVLHEYKKSSSQSSILFVTDWHRVVIDEAHCIRNYKTISFKAATAIKANCRWAVTGTPVQNRLGDFASLLRFLRAHPYTSKEAFERDLVHCWAMDDSSEPTARLRRLVHAVMLRRSKAMIQLPKRENIVLRLSFNPKEANQYSSIKTATAKSLDKSLDAQHLSARAYTNALTSINMLRRFCDIGKLASPNASYSENPMSGEQKLEWTTREAQVAYESLSAFGPLLCAHCGLEDRPEINLLKISGGEFAQLSQCLKYVCSNCSNGLLQQSICDDIPPCPVACVALDAGTSGQQTPEREADQISDGYPTKIEAVTKELTTVEDEKSVVFSSWRTTLDLVQAAMDRQGIRFVRVDGSIARQRRASIFDEFRNDSTVNVLLLTISCGAEGLDLTAASRVYLMEPQWNPTIEEQALARVHRIGQRRPVTTIRFIMQDSLEEQMVELQNRKKVLAELMLSETKPSEQSNRTRLQHLRALLK